MENFRHLRNPMSSTNAINPTNEVMGDGRAEIASNILGFLKGLYYPAIIKTRCPPASPESRRVGRWRAGPRCSASCDGARDRKKKAIH